MTTTKVFQSGNSQAVRIPRELRYGDHAAQRVRAKQKRWDEGIGYQEREVFEAFLKLPVAQRKVVREVILAFVKADEAVR